MADVLEPALSLGITTDTLRLRQVARLTSMLSTVRQVGRRHIKEDMSLVPEYIGYVDQSLERKGCKSASARRKGRRARVLNPKLTSESLLSMNNCGNCVRGQRFLPQCSGLTRA